MVGLLSKTMCKPELSEYGSNICRLWGICQDNELQIEKSVIISTEEFVFYKKQRLFCDDFINQCLMKINELESEIIDFNVSVDVDCYISDPIIAVRFSKVNVINTIKTIYERWFDSKSLAFRTIHKFPPNQTYPAIIIQPHRDDERITVTRHPISGALLSENDGEKIVYCTSKRLSQCEMNMIEQIDRISAKAYKIVYYFRQNNTDIIVRSLDEYNMTRDAFLSIIFEKMENGFLSNIQAIELLKPEDISLFIEYDFDAVYKYRGYEGSPGGTCGKVVFPWTDDSLINGFSVMLARDGSPELVDKLKRCCGAVFSRGGMTSHGAVICRGLKIPCVVSASDLMLDESRDIAYTSKEILNQGDIICLTRGEWGKTDYSLLKPKYRLECSKKWIGQINELVSCFSSEKVLEKYPLQFQFHIAELKRALNNVGCIE